MLINIVKKNSYYDSVFLMSIAAKIKSYDGVIDSAVMMSTDSNKELLKKVTLLSDSDDVRYSTSNDLLICLRLRDNIDQNALLKSVEELFYQKISTIEKQEAQPHSIDSAIKNFPQANIVSISVPGTYVKYLGLKALKHRLNLFIFSDNVPIEDELELKKTAEKAGLLVMGPDCGTAIIDGKVFGFGNAIRRGNIGIVAAAGTGLQELSVLIHNCDLGISHGIGVGSRDLQAEIGGISTIQAIKILEDDPQTEFIVLVSKPPAEKVAKKVIEYIAETDSTSGGRCKKKYVVNFLGAEVMSSPSDRLIFTPTIESAAIEVVKLAGVTGDKLKSMFLSQSDIDEIVESEVKKFSKSQKYIRGIFSGGTLCSEAQIVLRDISPPLSDVYSNVPIGNLKLKDGRKSYLHTIVDLGADEFTVGRPHPMIDNTLRCERIIQEAKDPEVAIILFDVLLGYGVPPDPVNELCNAIVKSQEIANNANRYISFIAHLCGTEDNPQNFNKQLKKLKSVGVILLPTNAQAAKVAGEIAKNLCLKKHLKNQK
ncbi:MAG: hypothetical protein QME68_02400 [Elusimicrobiota bacterium]|nr:hypothetical protein [Elusimicrobiota bacterium]